MELKTTFKISETISAPNIAELRPNDDAWQQDLETIGAQVVTEYDLDLSSRQEWETRNAEVLKLALQVTEQKTFPFPNGQSSNVKLPLITIAALQYHARAYPVLVPSTDIVHCRIDGDDPDGKKSKRAERIAKHMTYQRLVEDKDWEEQTDKVILCQPIMGSPFKKTYFDPARRTVISEQVRAEDLVIPYYAKSLEDSSRITHVLKLSSNQMYERVGRGLYRDFLDDMIPPSGNGDAHSGTQQIEQAQDQRQGIRKPGRDDDEPRKVLEQHRYLDLDGDGYKEPYIVTVDLTTRQVLRIVARYFKSDIQYSKDDKTRIVYIEPLHFFTKFPFIPSPDGGIYDLGFGSLLGPLNESTNTIINQMIDAGTMYNLGGGFLNKNVRIKGGQEFFNPGEYKRLEGPLADIRQAILPLPTKEPSAVLFQLLSLLINYSERVSGTTEIMVGENVGQNTPAGTAQEMVKQGSMIFNGIFKRTHRAFKEEYTKILRLNKLFASQLKVFELPITTRGFAIVESDYSELSIDVSPSADPNVSSDTQRQQQAQMLVQRSSVSPGYDRIKIERKLLEAYRIPGIDEFFNEKNPAPPNPKMAVEQMKLQIAQMRLQNDKLEFETTTRIKLMEMMQEADIDRATVDKLEAETMKLKAEAQGVEGNQRIALMQTQLNAAKAHQEGIFKAVQLAQGMLESMAKVKESNGQQKGTDNQQGGLGQLASSTANQGGQDLSQGAGGDTSQPMG